MTYNYRNGDKVFFKVVFGASHIPLEEEEAKRLAKALTEGRNGIMIFKMGMVDTSKIAGIFPDFERMHDWNVDGMDVKLPDIGKSLSLETPQDTNALREGQVKSTKELLDGREY